jgi:hypothetical protein
MNDDLNGVKIGSGLEAGNEADVGGTARARKQRVWYVNPACVNMSDRLRSIVTCHLKGESENGITSSHPAALPLSPGLGAI